MKGNSEAPAHSQNKVACLFGDDVVAGFQNRHSVKKPASSRFEILNFSTNYPLYCGSLYLQRGTVHTKPSHLMHACGAERDGTWSSYPIRTTVPVDMTTFQLNIRCRINLKQIVFHGEANCAPLIR
jgi:hypothetical protein